MTQSGVRQRTKVVLISSDASFRAHVRKMVESYGHLVLDEGNTSEAMARIVQHGEPDVLVCENRLSDGSSLRVLKEIYDQHAPVPAVIIAEGRDQEQMRDVVRDFYAACVFKPVREWDIGLAIVTVYSNFHQIKRLTQENDQLHQRLKDRGVIEKAKGILMRDKGWSEEKAFRWLQERAMNTRRRMVQVAQEIIGSK